MCINYNCTGYSNICQQNIKSFSGARVNDFKITFINNKRAICTTGTSNWFYRIFNLDLNYMDMFHFNSNYFETHFKTRDALKGYIFIFKSFDLYRVFHSCGHKSLGEIALPK